MTATKTAISCPDETMRCMARRLAEAVEQALDRGMFEQANRLAANGRRLAVHSSRLTDRLARLQLAQNKFDDALAIIDACLSCTASLRMLRAACLVQLGRHAEAHIALYAWSRKSTAPLATRRLLAFLDSASNDDDSAIAALTRNLHHVDDPATLEQLLVICMRQGRSEQAQHWAKRLRQASIVNHGTVEINVLCESLGLDRNATAAKPSTTQIDALAMELAAEPETLPILVQYQQHSFDAMVASLIYDATQQALDAFDQPAPAFEALARLAMLLKRETEAQQWAHRGLELNPMSASIILLLEQLDQEAEADAPVTEKPATDGVQRPRKAA